MLNSKEILIILKLLKKADLNELKGISLCCEDEFILKYKNFVNDDIFNTPIHFDKLQMREKI